MQALKKLCADDMECAAGDVDQLDHLFEEIERKGTSKGTAWVTHGTTGYSQLDAAWRSVEAQAERLIAIPGFGELAVMRHALAELWAVAGFSFESRLLPKVSASVGDRKGLHND
eukprot:COSAG06_NODE_3164_length_5749_cov_16.498407_2_plen_114_part_00